ncbi:hypothetical protein SAMN05216526_1860 [Ectothiorhodosinus mongolicus]|uniref:Uncharacterized protein n=1 Tax=Ectothiorhodosinus mongolicus TaxID=233100 RepID=A0A1R3W9A2_9GAMM|nr:hypothetical protein [Ectothiorhodosinus mongolicus]ULX57684.1 hypothetical protein CKX93_08465 [Ectothiorhodosinus mongolicus]SIT73529.1 hypothetical protein SAMN05216526_1860 [Ectothiorhodosinus mongolicus]
MAVKFWQRKKAATSDEQSSLQIETVGHSRIAQISASARKVPWLFNFLQLLWVAGPVTFIAMQSAYKLGFGEFAPARNVIYFVFFTLFLGSIGLGSKFVSVAFTQPRTERSAERLRQAMNWLPDLLFAIRDIDQAREDPGRRRLLAAATLLQEVELGPDGVALAVEEITGDASLAGAARQIELYRRLGLSSRVADLIEASADARLHALNQIHQTMPEIADTLRDRLMGTSPRREEGVARREGFVERLLAAADQEQPEALPLADIQELIVLLFELINGREIRYLHFEWQGSWEVARRVADVETARSRYRLAQTRMDNRLRHLGYRLLGWGEPPLSRADINGPVVPLAYRISEALVALLRQRPRSGTPLARQVTEIARLLQKLRHDRQRWLQAGKQFKQALHKWQAVQAKAHAKLPEEAGKKPLLAGLRRAPGLQIQEAVIGWADEQKLEFADALCSLLEQFELHMDSGNLSSGGSPMGPEDIQRLGLALLDLLQQSLDLGDLAVQRAIQAAPAAWMGGLHSVVGADARAGVAAAAVKDVRQDMGRMAERLAAQWVTWYQLPLSASLREQLVHEYQANAERLEMLANRPQDSERPPPDPTAMQAARAEVMENPLWDRLYALARRLAD